MHILKVHSTITQSRVMDACKAHLIGLDDPGFCLWCGEDAEGVEPDARKYECESCGHNEVYGADEVLLMGLYHADKGE